MRSSPTRICAILGVVILLLAVLVEVLALENGGDVLMIGLGLLLAATSMELLRRAYPPTS